jgi:hypothetical protein
VPAVATLRGPDTKPYFIGNLATCAAGGDRIAQRRGAHARGTGSNAKQMANQNKLD